MVEKLREELEDAKERLGLNEDFTGLQVTSIITKPEGSSYSCVLTDLLAKNGGASLSSPVPTDAMPSAQLQSNVPNRRVALLRPPARCRSRYRGDGATPG